MTAPILSPASSHGSTSSSTTMTTTTMKPSNTATSTTIRDPVQFIGLLRNKTRPYTDEELAWWIQAYTVGDIPDYQMAAWLMAVNLNGLSAAETATLTRCMVASGRRLEWSHLVPHNDAEGNARRILVDKHSTGGVGDKVSLILAPLAAVMGLKVPMIAGRGLGHTGGTIDKLEAIAGYNGSLDFDAFQKIVHDVGCCIIAAGPSLCPADKKLYALRDVTNTVASLPLITASIMCKKVAENPHSLVLDTKYGRGAFMKTWDEAQALAQSMINNGQANGVTPTTAFLTRMDEPIGEMVGNWLEVEECIRIMRGGNLTETCPKSYDLIALTCMQVGQMLLQSGLASPDKDLAHLAQEAFHVLESGVVLAKFREMIIAQGGDPDFVDHPQGRYPGKRIAVTAPQSGFVKAINGLTIGLLGVNLGAGRHVSTDVVDFVPGFIMNAKVGSYVEEGDVLAWVVTGKKEMDNAPALVAEAFEIADVQGPIVPIVTHRVSSTNGTEEVFLPHSLQKLYQHYLE